MLNIHMYTAFHIRAYRRPYRFATDLRSSHYYPQFEPHAIGRGNFQGITVTSQTRDLTVVNVNSGRKVNRESK